MIPSASMFQARSTLVQARERHQWKASLADLPSCAIPFRVLASASANASARLMNRYVSHQTSLPLSELNHGRLYSWLDSQSLISYTLLFFESSRFVVLHSLRAASSR